MCSLESILKMVKIEDRVRIIVHMTINRQNDETLNSMSKLFEYCFSVVYIYLLAPALNTITYDL